MADSSYLVDELLQGGDFFRSEVTLVPDIAVAEVLNALHVQERSLHLIKDGSRYADSLFDFIEAGQVQVFSTTRELALDALRIAKRTGGAPYGSLFVALALKAGLELRTRDRRQAGIMNDEEARRSGGHGREGTRT